MKYIAKVIKFGLKSQSMEVDIQTHINEMSDAGYQVDSHTSSATPLYIIHTFLWTKPAPSSATTQAK